MKNAFLYLLLVLPFIAKASVADSIIYDKTYRNNIKTVVLHPEGFEPTLPVLELGDESQKLQLSFDDLDNDNKFYGFTFIHCNADWTPSQLMFTQHTEGMMTDQITDWRFSINCQKPYTNYRVSFPTDNMKPKVSGNFIVKVFVDDDPNNIVLTKRFLVVEKLVDVTATIQRARNPEDRNYKQEIDFNIDLKALTITNTFDYVKPVLMQNERWDNAIYGLKPQYVNGQKLTYDYYQGNLFNGGNEFRHFDLRNARLVNDRVETIKFHADKQYHFYLYPEKNRLINKYYVMDDIDGRFFIRLMEGRDNYSEADYVWVHFKLLADYPVDGDVYAFGLLTNWQIQPNFKLDYNADDKAYEGMVMVKQGYYDYEYVLVKDGKTDDTYLEGTHYETENTYNILVYVRAFGDRADRLVGLNRLNSISGK